MMKKIFIPVCCLALAAACNNSEEEQPGSAPVEAAPEQVLKDSISKFPDSLILKESLIQYYREKDDLDKAFSVTHDYLKKDSLNARLWEIKATLHFENDDTLDAIRSFEKAVSILPDPRYLKPLGSLYAQTRNSKALAVADLLLNDKNAGADKEAFFIKGEYYNFTGDKEQAVSFFDKCLSLDYNFMYAYREKAVALYELGKYEEALKLLNKAVTVQNRFDEGYYWRGRCLEKLNRPDEAADEYRTALMYSPGFMEAKQALGRLEKK